MRKLSSKKGQIDLIMVGVTTLIMAGILLVLGLIILDELLLQNAATVSTVTNETVTSFSASGNQLAEAGACGFNGFSISAVTNATNASQTLTVNGNYTVGGSRNGRIFAVAGDPSIGRSVNVSYSYQSAGDNEACLATNQTIVAQGAFADYFDLIVLAIVITVVISLLLVVFSMRRVK